ncbi:hypothetical protein, partial [Vibrio sp. F13]|uniref:hypothetical protein n=1 Tax=Vibrio sp. F13 TaxID=2070777 RepID=UPI0019D03187
LLGHCNDHQITIRVSSFYSSISTISFHHNVMRDFQFFHPVIDIAARNAGDKLRQLVSVAMNDAKAHRLSSIVWKVPL